MYVCACAFTVIFYNMIYYKVEHNRDLKDGCVLKIFVPNISSNGKV